MILNATTKSFEVLLLGAITTAQLEWTLEAVEMNAGFALVDIVVNDGATNGTTAVTILAAPIAGRARQVKHLTVYNADSVAATVIVRLNNGGVFRRLDAQVLQPTESLHYVA